VGAHEGTALQVPVADGRELDVVLYGPEEEVPIVVHHGTPGGHRWVPDAHGRWMAARTGAKAKLRQ
jgi:dipeptidyl aminopeptidase/acylaminoacyl peptidase